MAEGLESDKETWHLGSSAVFSFFNIRYGRKFTAFLKVGVFPTSQLYTWFARDMGLFNVYFYESEFHLAVLKEAKDHSRTQGIRPPLFFFHMSSKGEKHTQWNRNSERLITDILVGHHVLSLSIKIPPAMPSAPYPAWVLHVRSFGLFYRASRS